MRTHIYTPDLSGKRIIVDDQEQFDKFWSSGHPEFMVPDFNASMPEDIWTGFLTYLDNMNSGEIWDQNGGEVYHKEVVDPSTGLTRCKYVAYVTLREGEEERQIEVEVHGYVVEGDRVYFLATRVDIDI